PLYAPSYVMSANRLTMPRQTMKRNAALRVADAVAAVVTRSIHENAGDFEYGKDSEDHERQDGEMTHAPRRDMGGDPGSNARPEGDRQAALRDHRTYGGDPHDQGRRTMRQSSARSAAHVRRRPDARSSHSLVAPLRKEDSREGDQCAAENARVL